MTEIPKLLNLTAENILKVKSWVKQDEKYQQDEKALKAIFEKASNTNLLDIYIKTILLNSIYSTQLRGRQFLDVAKFLYENDVEGVIKSGNPERLNEFIRKAQKSLKPLPYSFITKYVALSELYTNPSKNSFPIFDNIVNDMLNLMHSYYNDLNKVDFAKYICWFSMISIAKSLIKNPKQQELTFRDIDWYFWYLGREILAVINAINKKLRKQKIDIKLNKNFSLHNIDSYTKKLSNQDLTNLEIEYKEKIIKFGYIKFSIENILQFIENNHQTAK